MITNLETLTISELAETLKVDTRTIYRKINSNEIPFFRVGKNGSIRFHKDSIQKWIIDQTSNYIL